jgi:hypothetical protein
MGAECWGPVALVGAAGNPVSVSSPGRYNCWLTERAAMKRHLYARGLLVGAMCVVALAASTGVAHAQPDPFVPPAPGIIDLIVTETPAIFVDTQDEGGPGSDWGGVGMYCQNLFVRCSQESITH